MYVVGAGGTSIAKRGFMNPNDPDGPAPQGPISPHAEETQRETSEQALERARRERIHPDPVAASCCCNLEARFSQAVDRNPCAVVAAALGLGFVIGLVVAGADRR